MWQIHWPLDEFRALVLFGLGYIDLSHDSIAIISEFIFLPPNQENWIEGLEPLGPYAWGAVLHHIILVCTPWPISNYFVFFVIF